MRTGKSSSKNLAYGPENLAMLPTTFALFVAATQAFISATENDAIFFSLIVSWGEHGYNSSGVVPAIDMALEAIESRQILQDYNLTYALAQNSKVSPWFMQLFNICIICFRTYLFSVLEQIPLMPFLKTHN